MSQTANVCAINDSLLKINFGKHWDGITIERIASPPYPKIGTKIIFVEGERKRSLARSESQGRKSLKRISTGGGGGGAWWVTIVSRTLQGFAKIESACVCVWGGGGGMGEGGSGRGLSLRTR